ncbi:MAG: leucine-rich repeat protein [Ruminococcus sp.]|nr:leucine-rich repeat protein [Ruminococcus sp.]
MFKHKFFKGVICILSMLSMLLPQMPLDAFAETETIVETEGYIGDFQWTYEKITESKEMNNVLTIYGEGDIPSLEKLGIEQYPWETLNIYNIILSEGITKIPSHFSESRVVFLKMPTTLKRIESEAFYGDIVHISIDTYNLDCVYEERAFNLSENLGMKYIFALEDTTTEVFAKENNLNFMSYGKYGVPKFEYEIIDGYAKLKKCHGVFDTLEIPSEFEGYPLKVIGFSVLSSKSCRSILIPETVTTIEENAFHECYTLEEIKIPDGVTSIADGTFKGCVKLKNLILPDGITSIGEEAFSDCRSLEKLIIPDNVVSIGSRAFENCSNLTEIKLPDGITSIEEGAFSGCNNLTKITLPDSVTSIGEKAFSNCSSLEELIIPNSVNSIGGRAFAGCIRFKEMTIPESVRNIGWGGRIFEDCINLEKLTLNCNPNICSRIISNCTNFKELIIPKDVKIIYYTFIFDDLYYSVNINGSEELDVILNQNSFIDETGMQTFEVPPFVTIMYSDACNGYRSIKIGKNLRRFIDSGVADVDRVCWQLEDIEVDESNPYFCYENGTLYNKDKTKAVYTVPRYAYGTEGSCGENLTWKLDGFNLTISGSGEMTKCEKGKYTWNLFPIENVKFDGKDIRIADDAFYNAKYIKSVDLSGVTYVGVSAFLGCRNLVSVTNDESVKIVRAYALDGTKWIDQSGMITLGNVLLKCNSFEEEVTIPDNVTYIAANAFPANKTKVLYVPKNGVTYDTSAFINNTKLEHVRFIGSDNDITLEDIQEAAKLCKNVTLTDENDNIVQGFGFESDNTIMYLADVLRSTAFIENMTYDYCDQIIKQYNCTSDMTDIELITTIWDYANKNITYQYIYREDPYGTLYDENNTLWSLSSGITHFPVGVLAFEKGVCSSYASFVNSFVKKLHENGISDTLISMSGHGVDHEWNIVGLNTGTDNEEWYYLDLANKTYLIGYEDSIISNNPAIFGCDPDTIKNSDGTYTIQIDNDTFVNVQSKNLIVPYSKGDVTGNGKINIDDAAELLKIYAKNAAGITHEHISEKILTACDANNDGIININDASLILTYYSKYAAGLVPE